MKATDFPMLVIVVAFSRTRLSYILPLDGNRANW